MPALPDPHVKQRHLAQAKRFNTLAGREHRRADKLRMHERAMRHLYWALGWGEYPNPQQGKLL